MKLLYIKANPKQTEQSYTLRLAEAFLDEYRKTNPNDEIITLDLYKEGFKFLDESMLSDMFSGKETVMSTQANLFASVDKYVIAAPMWNLGSPAILKAYFDYVSIAGITFKYTEQGPIGLLANQGKAAIHIVARGGSYGQGPASQYEMGDKYIRTILGFFGITNVSTLAMELTNVLTGSELDTAFNSALKQAKESARSFGRTEALAK
jgi:FMN-dependent NADH-azoreductase